MKSVVDEANSFLFELDAQSAFAIYQPIAIMMGYFGTMVYDMFGKGEPHDSIEWSATLVPKCEFRKAKVLSYPFEERHRAQGWRKGRKSRGKLPPSKACK